jgi:hypothetical protein
MFSRWGKPSKLNDAKHPLEDELARCRAELAQKEDALSDLRLSHIASREEQRECQRRALLGLKEALTLTELWQSWQIDAELPKNCRRCPHVTSDTKTATMRRIAALIQTSISCMPDEELAPFNYLPPEVRCRIASFFEIDQMQTVRHVRLGYAVQSHVTTPGNVLASLCASCHAWSALAKPLLASHRSKVGPARIQAQQYRPST